MKFETKKKKQLETVKEWLSKARQEIESTAGWPTEFSLLIAMEQLVVYLEMEEKG